MNFSITRGSISIDIGETEGFVPPKRARFGGERFSGKGNKDIFVIGDGRWLIPNEDGKTWRLESMDEETQEKLITLIIDAAKKKGVDVERW